MSDEARPFYLVEAKLAEADFFLGQLENSLMNLFEARCYFSAFVSAARSVTFALQAVMKSQVDAFEEWYEPRQKELKQDPLARFFHDARTKAQHIGLNSVNAGSMTMVDGKRVVKLYFQSITLGALLKNAPSSDAITSCTRYMTTLVSLIHECYEVFGAEIDPHRYLTEENFRKLDRTIEDAEEEVIGVRGWTDVPGIPLEARWQMLRTTVPGSELGWIFEKYLDYSA